MTDTPDTLDIDPGPRLDIQVIELSDYATESTTAFLVRGTLDEALARRLAEQHVAQHYDADDAVFYGARLRAASCIATAGQWVEVENDPTTDDYTEYLSGDSLVTALAGRTVTLSEQFPGIRFILDTERTDD